MSLRACDSGDLAKSTSITLHHMPIVSDEDAVAFQRDQPEADPDFRRVELQIKLEEARNRSLETQLRLAELGASRDTNIFI